MATFLSIVDLFNGVFVFNVKKSPDLVNDFQLQMYSADIVVIRCSLCTT